MSIINKTTKQETLIRKDELNKNTFKVTVNTDDITIETTTNGITTFTSENYIDSIQLITQVPEPKIQTKAVTITENGSYTISPDDNLDALDHVYVTTNVPQYKIDSMRVYQNGIQNIITVAPEIIYVTEHNTDITDLIEADAKLHKFTSNSETYDYLRITEKGNYQYIVFKFNVVNGLYVSEIEINTPAVTNKYTITYILKLNTECNNSGLLYFCKGTTIEETTTLLCYNSEYARTEEGKQDPAIILYSSLLSENFPIK
ncbi:hypothetical protein CL6EHI_130540 [Entamoeba histolytica]|uniref:Uncharacterized protein n=2 Tax=Entamoeba histolytica TaxID=5759 RepID=C4MAQ5_ENTH1|nr:hypothetical protein EHI_130540 [Entamoeba histolytica HM-1:IMSS]EAL43047.1 hypothetical protein EHI_130540 [Entamoeba histolytica HM-1:IMSS]GAT98920.1 hypothetical protein CL6EHI_130540 [Entamoeba histolytica]|eukprot:XP_648432.1 hypothetical protein EHI_130540 [Entamoeba histolytica HM-1:IMSS]